MYNLVLTIFLINLSSYAQVAYDAKTTCEKIHSSKEGKSQESSFLDNVKSIFSSNSLEINYIQSKPNTFVDVKLDQTPTNNYIFLFKPLISEEALAAYKSTYDGIKDDIEAAQDNLEELVATRDEQDCISNFKKYPVTEKNYNELHAKLNSNRELNDYFGYLETVRQIKRLQKRGLSNSWKVVESTDINSLASVLRDKSTSNVIVLAHSSSSGFMVDSNSNIISPSVFKDISPGIQSINLFTCYGNKVRRNYRIDAEFKKGSLLNRALYTTIESSSMGDKTPIASFYSYFRKIDRKITKLKKLNLSVARRDNILEEKKNCTMNIDTSNALGNFSVYLNGHFIANPTADTAEYTFKCSFLRNESTLVISSSSYEEYNDENFYSVSIDSYTIVGVDQFSNISGFFDGARLNLQNNSTLK